MILDICWLILFTLSQICDKQFEKIIESVLILNFIQSQIDHPSLRSFASSSQIGNLSLIISLYSSFAISAVFNFQWPGPLLFSFIYSSSRSIAEWSDLIEGKISTFVTKSCSLSEINQ